MNDIRKYIDIIEQSTKHSATATPSSKYDETTSKFVSLIENAQFMVESFKDAKRKFVSQSDDTELVANYLETFKDLAKRNIIKGDEKDISQWIKGGWNEFKMFVDSKSNVKSKREENQEKKSDSIVVHEDSDKMVVIPLSEESSCYYGRNTQWCTAATSSTNYFNNYFGRDEITLFYILMKDGSKLAVAYTPEVSGYEAFDAEDDAIDMSTITELTGVTENNITAWYNKHKDVITEYQDAEYQFKKTIERYINGDISDESMNDKIEEYMSQCELEYEFDIRVKDGKAMIDVEPIMETVERYTKFLTGDDHLGIDGAHDLPASDIISRVDPDLQEKIFSKIANQYGTEIREIMDLEEDESFDLSDVEDTIDEFVEGHYDGDLRMALYRAEDDATQAGTEANIMREVEKHLEELFDTLGVQVPSNWFDLIDNPNTNFIDIPVRDIPAVFENAEDIDLDEPSLDIEVEVDDGYLGNAFKEAIYDSDFFD